MADITEIVTKEVIWSLKRHNNQGFDEENIALDTNMLIIFPSQKTYQAGKLEYNDEQANRCGMALLEVWRSICLQMDIVVTDIGYEPREELELFDVVYDVILYFENWTLLQMEDE